MQSLVKHAPAAPFLEVKLAPHDVLIAEVGTMLARSPSVAMEVRVDARRSMGLVAEVWLFFLAIVRKLFGGETFLVNHFSAPTGGWVWLAPAMSGAIHHLTMTGETLLIGAGAYVASAGEIRLDLRTGKQDSWHGKSGSYLIEATGKGELWMTAYGAIEEVNVDGSFVFDGGHVVAFDASLAYKNAFGMTAADAHDKREGIPIEFSGKGRVFVQTRNTGALVGWVSRMLP